jgi:hypothetical protein
MYSGETPKRFSKHKRQLRDSIIQWSVYKYSLLINTELNAFVQHQIDRTDDKFVQQEVRRLLLLGLRARDVSSRRDGSKIILQIHPLNTLRASTLNTIVHALISRRPNAADVSRNRYPPNRSKTAPATRAWSARAAAQEAMISSSVLYTIT